MPAGGKVGRKRSVPAAAALLQEFREEGPGEEKVTIREASKWIRAIIYQTGNEDTSVPEPALIISRYSDVIEIQQEDRTINLNPETVPEFMKVLKSAMKEKAE
jgi:hypothetical protein